jgi:hypothetical protein
MISTYKGKGIISLSSFGEFYNRPSCGIITALVNVTAFMRHSQGLKFEPFKIQWLLYVPPGLTLKILRSTHSVFMCFVGLSEQRAVISL